MLLDILFDSNLIKFRHDYDYPNLSLNINKFEKEVMIKA